MLFLPEIRLKRICDALINYLITDLKDCIAQNKENTSHLYLLFHTDSNDINKSVNYNEAKSIFLRDEANPRYLKVYPVFDRRRAQLPTIHIVVPQDNEDLNQIGDIEGDVYETEDISIMSLQRGYAANFNFIVTSDNINEVVLINYILRALLIGAIPQLNIIGFVNPKFSVQDLNINLDTSPVNCYSKGISMTASYWETVPEIGKDKKANNVVFIIDKIIY